MSRVRCALAALMNEALAWRTEAFVALNTLDSNSVDGERERKRFGGGREKTMAWGDWGEKQQRRRHAIVLPMLTFLRFLPITNPLCAFPTSSTA